VLAGLHACANMGGLRKEGPTLSKFGLKPRISLLVTQIVGLIVSGISVFTEGRAAAQTPGAAITLTRLSPPIFPDSVNSALVAGDVELKLGIRQDGSVESAAVVERHERSVNAPFANWGLSQLEQSALTSAKQSHFDCRACTLAITDYKLIYSFDPGPILRGDCPSSDPMNPLWIHSEGTRITQAGNHVIVTGPLQPLCPGPADFIWVDTDVLSAREKQNLLNENYNVSLR